MFLPADIKFWYAVSHDCHSHKTQISCEMHVSQTIYHKYSGAVLHLGFLLNDRTEKMNSQIPNHKSKSLTAVL